MGFIAQCPYLFINNKVESKAEICKFFALAFLLSLLLHPLTRIVASDLNLILNTIQ